MAGLLLTEFSDNDLLFLLETVDPRLVNRIDTIKNDPVIVEGMLEHEAGKLFQRITTIGEEGIMTRITPRFLFEILLRQALRDLESQSYTVERTATRKIPVFDATEVAQFLGKKEVLRYLADMLASFTRTESFTLPVRVRKGIWRKIRFSDMDIDSLARLCKTVDEEQRFGFYKRIADLCLFILGMFPEYATSSFHYSLNGKVRPGLFGRRKKSAEDYEEEGRRFYRLAGEHKNARTLELDEVFCQLNEKFNLAKKPLNHISENMLWFRKQKLFSSPSSS
jgi:hypothetical protein